MTCRVTCQNPTQKVDLKEKPNATTNKSDAGDLEVFVDWADSQTCLKAQNDRQRVSRIRERQRRRWRATKPSNRYRVN